MTDEVRSLLTGTLGLWILILVAAFLTAFRFRLSSSHSHRGRTAWLVVVGIVCQSLHFGEELTTRFYDRFPELLGLAAWSREWFVWFNVSWIIVWIVAAFGLRRGITIAVFPLWFLALAMLLNGVAHLLLALRVQAYFPGLVTAPLVGIVGYVLVSRLWRITAPEPRGGSEDLQGSA